MSRLVSGYKVEKKTDIADRANDVPAFSKMIISREHTEELSSNQNRDIWIESQRKIFLYSNYLNTFPQYLKKDL